MRTQFRAIARVQKTHGKLGEVVCEAPRGLPLLIEPGQELYVVPPNLEGPRVLHVVSTEDSAHAQLVEFEELEDINAAQALVGKSLLCDVSALPNTADYLDLNDLIGLEVIDIKLGSLGKLTEIMQGDYQDVWQCKSLEGELLFPVLDDVVLDISKTEISVQTKEGSIVRLS